MARPKNHIAALKKKVALHHKKLRKEVLRVRKHMGKKYQQLHTKIIKKYRELYRFDAGDFTEENAREVLVEFSSLNKTLKPYRIPTLILCLGFTLSICGFLAALGRNMDERERQFFYYAHTQEVAMRQTFNNYLEDMELSQHFFKTSSWVTKEEFATFITPLKKRGNFSLFTRLNFDQSEEGVSIMQAHITNDSIKERMIPSILEKTEIIKGLRQAKEEGVMAFSSPFSFDKSTKNYIGLAFPYYQSGFLSKSATVEGFVLGVLDLKSIFSNTLGWEENRKNIAVYIYESSHDKNNLIYAANKREVAFSPNIDQPQMLDALVRQQPFHYTTSISLANSTWKVVFAPTNEYLAGVANIFPWFVMLGGIVITSLITIFTFYLTAHNLMVSRQVDERTHELEEAMKRLSRTNIELERFAYVASHDLQEPLRLISNFTDILHEEYQNKFDKEGKKYMQIIVTEAEHMQELIRGLLAYAKVGKDGTMPMQEEDCNELVKRVLQNLHMRIKETNATVTHDKMPTIVCNAVPIMQLLQNLVSNALKYCRDRAPVIHIKCEEEDGFWVFSVEDNGIGIKEEFIKKVFEPFKRLHRKDEFEGTGIGLAICKKTVDYLGGKMWAESMYGKGSIFYFTIPKKQKEQT